MTCDYVLYASYLRLLSVEKLPVSNQVCLNGYVFRKTKPNAPKEDTLVRFTAVIWVVLRET